MSLFSALKPVNRIGADAVFWIVRWPRRTRYAPMPTERPVANVSVNDDAFAREVCGAPRSKVKQHHQAMDQSHATTPESASTLPVRVH